MFIPKQEKKFKEALIVSLILQVALFIMGYLGLDGGHLLALFIRSIFVYWLGFLIIAIRRKDSFSKTDFLYTKYGILLIAFAAVLINEIIYS